ncbi:hypothetical protein DVH24_013471 [Malus domestica]|uniref:Uncharacterized protein n=1 Tax=Malus domestica TaxID=3750 RepID=A0A498HMF8_MALDO|nr:hypothetical protein DVH24_013471 [Malus domestica]
MNDYILQPQVVPKLYSKRFCHYMRGILDTACWVFPKAEQEMTIVWALERHKNLDSCLTLVRTSFKAKSYLIEIAQAGAKWGVIFDTMLAEADFQKNHFKVHPPFLVMQLHHIHPVVQPTCLPSQLLATGVGILHPKSRLHPYQVLSVQRIEADMCNLLVALASSLGSKKMKLEHEKLVVFLLLGAHEFTLHSQISLVEFSIGAQARVVLEPRATILEFSLVLGATIKHFLTWHHGVSFSVFHQGLAISFLTQGLLILWTGIMVYLEIHTVLILAASIMIISGTPRLERPTSARL